MALNLPYEAIGKGFVQQYYSLFDDPAQRPNLINMYNADTSFMTFEGLQIQGAIKIMEKLTSLSFQKINRIITAIDSQPMFDGGILINVLGRLQDSVIKKIQSVIVNDWADRRGSAPCLHPDICPEADWYQLLCAARHLQTCIARHGLGIRYTKQPLLHITAVQADEDPPHPFSQTFVLMPAGNSYYCQHDIFRLGIHNSA